MSAARVALREGGEGRLGRLIARARRARPQLANGRQAFARSDTDGSLALPLYSQPPSLPHWPTVFRAQLGAGACPPPSWLSLLLESGHLRRSGRLQSSAPLQHPAQRQSYRPPTCGSASAAQAAAGVLSRDSVAATILLKRAGRARPPPLLTASLFFLLHVCTRRRLSDYEKRQSSPLTSISLTSIAAPLACCAERGASNAFTYTAIQIEPNADQRSMDEVCTSPSLRRDARVKRLPSAQPPRQE